MTESDWFTCNDPRAMLTFRRGRQEVSDRKSRLFAVACCRRIWPLLRDRRSRRAVEAGEQHADAEVAREWLERVFVAAGKVTSHLRLCDNSYAQAAEAAYVVAHHDAPVWAAYMAAEYAADARGPDREGERAAQADLFRCNFGNPFTSTLFSFEWRTSTVVALAQGIYEERAFDRLPLLMDALMDAGCDNEDILAHCRGTGPHARGCWVVDLVLGKV